MLAIRNWRSIALLPALFYGAWTSAQPAPAVMRKGVKKPDSNSQKA